MNQEQVNAAFLDDFANDTFAAAAAPGAEFDLDVYGGPIIDKLKERAALLKDFVTVEMLLYGAKLAFDFAIGRIPFPVPQAAKDALWALAEQAIRALYA